MCVYVCLCMYVCEAHLFMSCDSVYIMFDLKKSINYIKSLNYIHTYIHVVVIQRLTALNGSES